MSVRQSARRIRMEGSPGHSWGHYPGLHKKANRAEVRSKLAFCNPQDTGSLGPVRDAESGGLEIDATSISPTPL